MEFNRPSPSHPQTKLVGGFIPFEKDSSNWIISPGRGENKKYLKPPPRKDEKHTICLYIFMLKNFKKNIVCT